MTDTYRNAGYFWIGLFILFVGAKIHDEICGATLLSTLLILLFIVMFCFTNFISWRREYG